MTWFGAVRCSVWLGIGLSSCNALAQQPPEFRALWVDTFHAALRTSNEVTQLVDEARANNFNAVIVEVRKRGDAYYNSLFEPKATDVSPQSFDPLADLISKAHNGGRRIEVPTDNENGNATGAVDFGGGKVFALDSNNGIIALTLGSIPQPGPGRISIARNGTNVTLTWAGAFTLQAANVVTGSYIDIATALSGYSENTSTNGPERYFRLRN